MSTYLYQLHSIAISKDLKVFFNKSCSNIIKFWDCPNLIKLSPHSLVNRKTKHLKIDSIFSSKLLWEVDKKEECNSIVHKWQMIFQASEFKGRKFLELDNDSHNSICPTYSKDRVWMKFCSISNLLCACIIRMIKNHAPIGKYRLRFFSKESITCLYGKYSIEIRKHILFKCLRYNKSWNLKMESLKDILTFLEFNSGVFCFCEDITWGEVSSYELWSSLYFPFLFILSLFLLI